jgi:hypothetical protein
MEPDASLPLSQDPTTGPYPEPDETSPHFPLRYILTLPFHLSLSFPSGLFPSGFLTEMYAIPHGPNACCMFRQSHPPRFDHPNNNNNNNK